MIKVELRVSIIAREWDPDKDDPPELTKHKMGTNIVFSEESTKQYRDIDVIRELVKIWWRDLEKIMPGKLEDMARNALGV